MTLPQLFGVIPTGCPLIITPTSAPAPTSLLYKLPLRPFSHLTVFLLPDIALPPNTAAAVYIAFPSAGDSNPSFKFLGGIGPGKESAVFKVGNTAGAGGSDVVNVMLTGEVDMDAPETDPASTAAPREIVLGISIEASSAVSAQMAALAASAAARKNGSGNANNGQELAMVMRQQEKPNTLLMAQKIIKNAFNFLASFSGTVQIPGSNGTSKVEAIPLKAFEEWWRKFEAKLRNDPLYLEKEID